MKRGNAWFSKAFGPSLFWLPIDAFIIIQGALDHWWFFVVLGAILALLDLNVLRKRARRGRSSSRSACSTSTSTGSPTHVWDARSHDRHH